MTTTLAIETATANRWQPASIALRHGDSEILEVLEEPNSQAAELVPRIEALLESCGIWYDALQRLIITIGPGSFTGIRIGLAVARTVAFACPKLTLVPVSTLEAMAASRQGDTPFTAMLRAGKGEVYTQPYEQRSGKWAAAADIDLQHPDMLDQSLTLFGNGMEGYAHHFTAQDLLHAPDRVAIATHEPAPLYIRPPDAKLPKAGAL